MSGVVFAAHRQQVCRDVRGFIRDYILSRQKQFRDSIFRSQLQWIDAKNSCDTAPMNAKILKSSSENLFFGFYFFIKRLDGQRASARVHVSSKKDTNFPDAKNKINGQDNQNAHPRRTNEERQIHVNKCCRL